MRATWIRWYSDDAGGRRFVRRVGGRRRLEELVDRQPSRAGKCFDTVEVNPSFITFSRV